MDPPGCELVEKHQVQVFGTTHNDDIIKRSWRHSSGKDGMLGLFRIDRRDDRHVMVAYNDEAMEAVSHGYRSRFEDECQDPEKNKLLIVEGRDKEMFFEAALADHLGLNDIQILPIGGKTPVGDEPRGAGERPCASRAVQSLAVLRDADSPLGDAPAATTGGLLRPRRRFNPSPAP